MINSSDSGGAGFVPVPLGIVLRADAGTGFTVSSAPVACPFEPFALPRAPVSLLAWCSTLAGMFRQRHNRCLGCVLTLDPGERRWTRALVPAQRCEPNRAIVPANFSAIASQLLPRTVVAGSSQSTSLWDPDELNLLVPEFDGLHVIEYLADENDHGCETPHCYVRARGVLHSVDVETVIFDDWVAALRQHSDRLTLE